jgi:hypothetical protein
MSSIRVLSGKISPEVITMRLPVSEFSLLVPPAFLVNAHPHTGVRMNAEGFGIQVLTGQLIWVTLIPAGNYLDGSKTSRSNFALIGRIILYQNNRA